MKLEPIFIFLMLLGSLSAINVSACGYLNGENTTFTFFNATSNKIKFNTTAGLPIWVPGTNLNVQYITKTIWVH